MWKQFLDLFRQMLLLGENAKRNRDDLADLQKKVAGLSHSTAQNFHSVEVAVEQLAYQIKRLEDELRPSREREADARERLRMEIENRLLRESRQLPPATEQPKKDDAELLKVNLRDLPFTSGQHFAQTPAVLIGTPGK